MAVVDNFAVNITDMGFRYPDNDVVSFSKLNLKIAKGERFGLFGPNGAGKTTLMNLMTGVLQVDEGKITLLGNNIGHQKNEVNKLFGFVPQDFSFYQELSPVENLEFFNSIVEIFSFLFSSLILWLKTIRIVVIFSVTVLYV